nr:uncharacterized protein LOC111425889 [Onthophagus taurus]
MDLITSTLQNDQIDDKWDIFDEPPELSDESPDEEDEKWKTLERFTKLLIYIITFLMVLFGSVISKATLLFVTAQISRKSKQYCKENVGSEGEFMVELPEEEIVAWMWILIFIYFVPQLATFLRSWRILLFKKWKTPGILEFVSVFLGESSSTIGNSILVFYVLPRSDFTNDDSYNLVITNSYLTPIWVLTLSIIATYLTYIFGKFACKINIQRISYAAPLHLSGVVTVLGILVLSIEYTNNNNCAYSSIIPSYLFFNDSINYEVEDIWLIFMGLLLLVSFILVTFHIRAPQNESLASTEKLYVRPYYEPFFIDQDLALNRRRNDEFDYRKDKETFSNDTENVEPMLYVCGTMWHETKEEMITFLKSIVYLDEDHCLRRIGKNYVKSINYYKLESHIVFDHAFTKTSQGNQQAQMNDFVKDLINSVKEVVAMVHKCNIKLKEPIKYVTPYGGKLEWVLPGKTKLIAHLKDNDKIRSKKRWSQVMYLYYILGHRIMGRNDLNNIQKELEAENTFILSVDGDIRFRPKAVHMLLEYMKRDKTLAAACGRVHPVGKGIFSWYQKFEYAISHWMYKASENVVGCILCCPGCFTIFRATAVMSIIKKLTTKSTKAVHFIKFDHGEDRWISTLLVLCGFKVGYVASSDAYTNCPEGFRELFNQRRRWIPSTTANILDLLSRTISWGTREINKESITEEVTEKSWINDNDLRHGSIGNISEEENVFWVKLLNKYLYPLDDAKNKSRMIDDLKDLREKVISSLIIVNEWREELVM